MRHEIAYLAVLVLPFIGCQPRVVASETSDRFTAMVLLTAAELPESAALQNAFLRYNSTSTLEVSTGDVPEGAESGDMLVLTHSSGATGFVMLLPMPIPNNEAEAAARGSLSFAEGWTVPSYDAHAIVTLARSERTDVFDHLNLFTDIVAAIVDSSPAVGVYWGDAGATHSAEFFTDVASERDRTLRMPLWSGMSIVMPSEGRASILSLGMTQLGFMELMMDVPLDDLDEAVFTHYDLLSYAVSRGGPIPDGDTVGSTMDERIPVRHVPSPIDPTRQVWSVVYP